VSTKVFIIPEDFRKDQFILRPLIRCMLKGIGMRAKVDICREPLLAGIGEALKWDRIREILDNNRSMDVHDLRPSSGSSKVLTDRVVDTSIHRAAQRPNLPSTS